MLEERKIDNVLKNISNWFNKERKFIFLVTFLVGLFVHFEVYSKGLLAYDGYWHYGAYIARGWEISLGRFLIPFSDIMRGSIVTSFLTTVISLIIMSFSAIFLNEVLEIRNKYLKALIGIVLVVTPTLSLTLMYAYTACGYTFAMLFSILSIYFLKKEKNLKNIILTIMCVVITLAFYQAYLCVISTLFIITYIFKQITNNDCKIKNIILDILKDALILACGVIIYYICFNIIVKILHLDISSYSGGNSLLSLETIKNIIPSIKNTYITFFNFYFGNSIVNNTYWHRQYIYPVILLAIIINFVMIIINNKIYKIPSKLALFIVMILVFPVFACSIRIIAWTREINLLMASSLYFTIMIFIKQLEIVNKTKITKIVNSVASIFIVVLIWTYILSNQATYVATTLYNKQMEAVGNRIIQRIEQNPQITPDTPIVLLGKLNFDVYNSELINLTNFDVSEINTWTWQIFLQDRLGLGRSICNWEEYDEILNSEEYANMPIYPDEYCIKIINGTAVVKLNY